MIPRKESSFVARGAARPSWRGLRRADAEVARGYPIRTQAPRLAGEERNVVVGRQWCQHEEEVENGRGSWVTSPNDRPSEGKYGRHFSAQSLPQATSPLIGTES